MIFCNNPPPPPICGFYCVDPAFYRPLCLGVGTLEGASCGREATGKDDTQDTPPSTAAPSLSPLGGDRRGRTPALGGQQLCHTKAIRGVHGAPPGVKDAGDRRRGGPWPAP